MTLMLNLGKIWVNALEVESVERHHRDSYIIVKMKSGDVHNCAPSMVAELSSFEAKLISDINHAALLMAGALPKQEMKFKPSGN